MDELSQAALDLANASVRSFTHGTTPENNAQLRAAVDALLPLMVGVKPEEALGDVVRRCIFVDMRATRFALLPADTRLGFVAAARAVRDVALAMEPAQPTAEAQDALKQRLRDALIEQLGAEIGDSYDCTRVWSAWSHGTMSQQDFVPVDDRLGDIVEGLLERIANVLHPLPATPPASQPSTVEENPS